MRIMLANWMEDKFSSARNAFVKHICTASLEISEAKAPQMGCQNLLTDALLNMTIISHSTRICSEDSSIVYDCRAC
jgi:hypothetical protein